MAFVIVQHLDPNHESMMAQLLDRHTSLEVLQSEGGERIKADTVYIIPPGHGLAICDGVLELTEFAQPRGLRRPIDDFFVSLASDQQSDAACVILSGTGADGTTGLRAIKENGGVCLVQDPATARYDGMPLSAVSTGLVDFVKRPTDMLDCLTSYFKKRRQGDDVSDEATLVADHVDDMCKALRSAVGHDFSGYKRTTLIRRVERRMHVLGIMSGHTYLARLRADREECDALFRDLLINVTRFFRDSELFDRLRATVIVPLVQEHQDEELRVWIPGCSSGEEAYSLAMLLAEEAERNGKSTANIQVFATDIDERMLQIAREGSYPAAALADIPATFREKYLIPHSERFTVASHIRDMIRFSAHSLVKDPPFSRIDLLSCRNLFIYFDDGLQQSVLPLLHYSIKPEGYLFLGPSESVGRYDHLFPSLDAQARIFQRAPGPPNYPIDLPGNPPTRNSRGEQAASRGRSSRLENENNAVRRLVERYSPASLVLDQDGGIIAAYGRLGRYFDFPVTRTGGSSAITLARPGLRAVIGPLLREARDARKGVVIRNVDVETEYGIQPIDVICDPLPDGTLLFIFRETAPFQPQLDVDAIELDASDDHLDALEDELRVTRHRLRSAVEELETANEELKSSNEEMMSMNEELQSTNEELTTVNDELKSKVDQLTVANSDLRNFFESTDMAVIVLDADLRIRSYTEAATVLFPLQNSDRGRPLGDVTSRLDGRTYLEDARIVAAGHDSVHRRVTAFEGSRTLSLRTLPYRMQNGVTDGVTIVITDITDALTMERDLAAERERLQMAIQAGGVAIWEYDIAADMAVVDGHAREILGISKDMVDAQQRWQRIHADDREATRASVAKAVAGNGDLEVTYRVVDEGHTRWIKTFGRLVEHDENRRLVGVSIDVTPEYVLAETRELMIREMNHRVKNLFAITAGMISAGARSYTDVREFASDLRERIAALGNAHSLASPTGEAHSIDLKELLATTIKPYSNHATIKISGPTIHISRSCLSPLALIFHEWATNAVKYGALAERGGALNVEWSQSENDISLLWRETFENPITHKSGTGFGTVLVKTSSLQLGADVHKEALGGSFTIRLRLPKKVLAYD
jgi:two-component system CheB/CheR fusion protein